MTRNGNNGGWLRRCSQSSSSIGLTVDEDIDTDSERSHIGEAAGIVAASTAFHVNFAVDLAVSKSDFLVVFLFLSGLVCSTRFIAYSGIVCQTCSLLIRTIGRVRARTKIGLKNLTYNFQRFLVLTVGVRRQPA